MKKLCYLMSLVAIVAISSALILTGCKKEKEDILDLDMANITQMTESQRAIFDEAVKRIDPFVTFTDGQFVMSINDGEKVGVSVRLFTVIRCEMDNTNSLLRNEYKHSRVPILLSDKKVKLVGENEKFDFALTKAHGAFEEGGITDYEFSFDRGLTLYLSDESLRNIGRAIELGGVVAGVYTGGLSGVAIGTIITASGWSISDLRGACPDGIIIYHAGLGTTPPPIIVPQHGGM